MRIHTYMHALVKVVLLLSLSQQGPSLECMLLLSLSLSQKVVGSSESESVQDSICMPLTDGYMPLTDGYMPWCFTPAGMYTQVSNAYYV